MANGPENKRSKGQKEEDQKRISELFVKGYSLRRMAKTISAERKDYTLSHVQIKNDLDKILKEWRKQAFQNIDDKQLIEIHKLNKVESEAWIAYDLMAVSREKGFSSSAKFLDIALKCIEKRCRIFGIEKTPETFTERQIIIVSLPSIQEEEAADNEAQPASD